MRQPVQSWPMKSLRVNSFLGSIASTSLFPARQVRGRGSRRNQQEQRVVCVTPTPPCALTYLACALQNPLRQHSSPPLQRTTPSMQLGGRGEWAQPIGAESCLRHPSYPFRLASLRRCLFPRKRGRVVCLPSLRALLLGSKGREHGRNQQEQRAPPPPKLRSNRKVRLNRFACSHCDQSGGRFVCVGLFSPNQ